MAVLLVVTVAMVMSYVIHSLYQDVLVIKELSNIGDDVVQDSLLIDRAIQQLTEDIRLLSNVPPISGTSRAKANNGYDELGGSSEAVWLDRLSVIFRSLAKEREHYLDISLIDLAAPGRELIVVERIKNNVTVKSQSHLKNVSHLKSYQETKVLEKGQLYVSSVHLLKKEQQIVEPRVPVLTSGIPLYDDTGRLFLLILITMDVSDLLTDLNERYKESEGSYYLTNETGRYLIHPKSQISMQIETPGAGNIYDLFPRLKAYYDEEDISFENVSYHQREGADHADAIYMRKIFFQKDDHRHYLAIVKVVPYETVIAGSEEIRRVGFLVATGLAILASLVALILSTIITRPLRNITNAVHCYADTGKVDKTLLTKNKDEIGLLSSEFIRMVEKIDLINRQLMQADKMAAIGQLSAGVAHEINNPVGYVSSNLSTLESYISNMLEVIDQYEQQLKSAVGIDDLATDVDEIRDKFEIEYLKDDVRDLIAESHEGLERVRAIVQDLKGFSHANEEEWQYADIHRCLDSTLNIVHNELKYKAVVNKYYGNLPNVMCIASQINQVFLNMLVNAAHAMTAKGEITITTGVQAADWVWVKISDNGRGIDEENISHIFDPFYTTKPVGEGTGLGLSLSYGIVEKHNGRIEVESKLGVGTTFTIWLPTMQDDQKAVA
ncbi:MAG: ATP-binding protein [Gammaproteobacteria bacterium]